MNGRKISTKIHANVLNGLRLSNTTTTIVATTVIRNNKLITGDNKLSYNPHISII